MTTDQALDKMVQITPWLGMIFDDADASDIVKTVRDEKAQTPAGTVMAQLIPLFAGKHREAMYNIVALTSGVPVDEVKNQPIIKTLNSLHGALIDETMMFFMACLRMVKNI